MERLVRTDEGDVGAVEGGDYPSAAVSDDLAGEEGADGVRNRVVRMDDVQTSLVVRYLGEFRRESKGVRGVAKSG